MLDHVKAPFRGPEGADDELTGRYEQEDGYEHDKRNIPKNAHRRERERFRAAFSTIALVWSPASTTPAPSRAIRVSRLGGCRSDYWPPTIESQFFMTTALAFWIC